MRILVTGSEGFVGSVLVPILKELGHDVIGVDRLIFGKHNDIFILKNDLEITTLKGFDIIIHLAAVVGDPACLANRDFALQTNVRDTANLAKTAKENGVKKFIFISSCSVYGAQPTNILTEESDPIPVDYYGLTKLAGEHLVARNFPNATIFRFGTLFGFSPRMRFDLVVNSFVAKAYIGRPLTIYGGNQHRPLLHLYDACSAIILAVEKDMYGIFNVTSGNYTIQEIINELSRKMKFNYSIEKEMVDKRDYMVSTNKIREFGYVPRRTLENGINDILSAFWDNKITKIDNPIYYNDKVNYK